ncbi:Hypothetical predicted protein, partial [Pelobates cultripes]
LLAAAYHVFPVGCAPPLTAYIRGLRLLPALHRMTLPFDSDFNWKYLSKSPISIHVVAVSK